MNQWRWPVLASMAGVLLLGGCSSSPPDNATPEIRNLFPSNITVGSPAFTLSVQGTGFISTSRGASFVYWNGFARSTTLNQTTGQLQVQVLASDVASPGPASVTVINPAPGGGTSTAAAFVVEPLEPGAPAITSLSPANAMAGGNSFTLTVNGSNFAANDPVTWNGSVQITTFVNSTQVTAAIASTNIAAAGSASVAVFTPNLVVGSPSVTFPITGSPNPKPTVSSLFPPAAPAGIGDLQVLVSGSGFTSLSNAQWTFGANSTPLALAFVGGSQVIVLIPAGNLAQSGTAMIEISNPAPGGGTSSQLTFTVSD
ncbi:MAG TPA: IPT/TIG domain-containing protein [Candidatus Acidoferrales bacterium]|nr:IPT/TIG domain-containing protein [Candidatus Acidoferrales bacterium]